MAVPAMAHSTQVAGDWPWQGSDRAVAGPSKLEADVDHSSSSTGTCRTLAPARTIWAWRRSGLVTPQSELLTWRSR